MTEEAQDVPRDEAPAEAPEGKKPRKPAKEKPPEPAPIDPRRARIRNVLNVQALDLPLPEGGGIICLEGLNGSGKSNALRALQAGLEGDGTLAAGTLTEGAFVEVAGLRMEMGRRKRRGYHDDLAFRVIGNLDDPSLIVDPKIDSPEAADADRIKRLARMLRLDADVEPFLSLFTNPADASSGREELDRILTPELQQEAVDLPQLAGRIKRAAENDALLAEGEVEHLDAQLEAIARSIEPVAQYLGDACDEAVLREAHEEAVRALDRAEQHNEAAGRAAKSRREAELTLDEAEARGLPDPQVLRDEVARKEQKHDEAVAEVAARMVRSETARAAVTAAREALRLAEAAYEERVREEAAAGNMAEAAKREFVLAQNAVPRAETALRALDELRGVLDRALPTVIPDLELLELRALVDEAAGNRDRGVAVRAAHKRRAESLLVQDQRERAHLHARRMRDAAAGVEGVLSTIVSREATQSLVVSNGRLLVEGRPRGVEFFAELSWGERWFLVYVVLLHATGKGGIVMLPQEAFEGLDPDNVRRAARLAVDMDVVVVTARPATGPLSVVLLDAEGEVLRRVEQPAIEKQQLLGELPPTEGGDA